jgi:hypothetical protein
MHAAEGSEKVQGIALLSIMMKIQAIAFLIYGLFFFLTPAWTLEGIFGFEKLPPLIYSRIIGAVFLAIVPAEYLCFRRPLERLDLAWFFVAAPGFMLVAFIWEGIAGTYEGTAFFYWSSIFVTLFFTVVIALSRIRVKGI